MKRVVVSVLLLFFACKGDVECPTCISQEPPPDKQCQVIADREHLTPEQRADRSILCDCYELQDGWWQFVFCSPDQSCVVPHAQAPGWSKSINRPSEKLEVVEAAKVVVDERCGENPFRTLELLAEALVEMGECAAGPWHDALAVLASDGLYEEFHSVAFTNGCWYGPAYKGTWHYSGGTE